VTLFDPTIGEDAWVTFACVACGCSVHTLVPNPEQRCGVCQFISECAPKDQDGLRDLLIRGGATPREPPRRMNDGAKVLIVCAVGSGLIVLMHALGWHW
jgi:hypothetical protein